MSDLIRQAYGNMSDRYMTPVSDTAKVTPAGKDNAVNSVSPTGKVECKTCKERKYQDGSDEMVSFKTPGNIAPGESYAKVMGHELEHVANAKAEGSKENKELVSVSVSLHTAVCPECGRSYVSGGETRVVMKTFTGGKKGGSKEDARIDGGDKEKTVRAEISPRSIKKVTYGKDPYGRNLKAFQAEATKGNRIDEGV